MEKNKGYLIKEDIIIIARNLTELDIFLKDFLNILKKHSDYLVVSGFVSISTGRTRGTEDIDVLVPVTHETKFKEIFTDLTNNGFWCYQSDDHGKAYTSLKEFESIRFARINEMYPNIEFIPIDESKKLKYFEFLNPQKIRIANFEFKIPPIEFEILYKEIVLGSEKDIADARHLRSFFLDILNKDKLNEYKKIIKENLK